MKKALGLPKNVLALGFVSLFMDISSEMVYPLIPLFLSNVLNASKLSIGLIEGVAESTASILKVFSGYLSDRLGKRKSIIFWGYSISVFSRPILATASSWMGVLIYRFTDRFGKGIRTPPRDAIIADSTDKGVLGKAFGFHRSMDTIGAVIGPGLAFIILGLSSGSIQWVFWMSIIPGLFAMLCIIFLVKDTRRNPVKEFPSVFFGNLDRDFKVFLVVVVIFTLGRTTEVFLILRVHELGVSTTTIPILYMVFNMISAILSTPAGIIADRFGKRKTIIASYVLCSAIFFGFSHATNHYHGWILFISYGIFVAMNEGVQRAYVATVVKPECIATGYGVYHTVLGLAALPSSIIDGALWQYYGSRGLFYYGTITTLTAFFLFVLFLKKPRTTNQGL